jgi:hypothetical protein
LHVDVGVVVVTIFLLCLRKWLYQNSKASLMFLEEMNLAKPCRKRKIEGFVIVIMAKKNQ